MTTAAKHTRSDDDRLILHVEKALDDAQAQEVRRALWTVDGVYGVQFNPCDRIAVVFTEGGKSCHSQLVQAVLDAGYGVIDPVEHKVLGLAWEDE